VEVTPYADPSLAAALAAHHLKVSEFHQVLVLELDDAPAREHGVRPIEPGEELAWARTVIAGFSPDDTVSAEGVAMALPTTRMEGTTCFGAFVDGELVGGGTLAVSDGVAMLSGTAVRAPFRGRGLHAALIRARLHDARRQRADLAATSTLPWSQSQRNLEKLGFRVRYPKVVLSASSSSS
jgi:GNAT superfamily N-acetyltransferase